MPQEVEFSEDNKFGVKPLVKNYDTLRAAGRMLEVYAKLAPTAEDMAKYAKASEAVEALLPDAFPVIHAGRTGEIAQSDSKDSAEGGE